MFPSLPVLPRLPVGPVCVALVALLLSPPAIAQGLCVVVDSYCGGGSSPPPVCSLIETRSRACVDAANAPFTATSQRSYSLAGGTCVPGAWSAWAPPGGTCSAVTACSQVRTETRACHGGGQQEDSGNLDNLVSWQSITEQTRTKAQYEQGGTCHWPDSWSDWSPACPDRLCDPGLVDVDGVCHVRCADGVLVEQGTPCIGGLCPDGVTTIPDGSDPADVCRPTDCPGGYQVANGVDCDDVKECSDGTLVPVDEVCPEPCAPSVRTRDCQAPDEDSHQSS